MAGSIELRERSGPKPHDAKRGSDVEHSIPFTKPRRVIGSVRLTLCSINGIATLIAAQSNCVISDFYRS